MASRDVMQEIARSFVDAYNGKNYVQLRELLADDVAVEDVGMGLSLEGGERFVEAIKDVAERAAPDRKLRLDAMHVDGDAVICEGGWSATFEVEKWGFAPGTKHSHRSCTVLQIRDGQIAGFTDYTCPTKQEPRAEAAHA